MFSQENEANLEGSQPRRKEERNGVQRVFLRAFGVFLPSGSKEQVVDERLI